MTVQTNNAEATVGAGVTVTTANQGGAISAGGAYNTVTGAHTFDSGSHFDGALCYSPACVTGTNYVLQRSGFTVTVFRKRFYFKIDATPTTIVQFLALRNASAAVFSAKWLTNNTIQFSDAATIFSTGTLTPGNWYGIDMVITPNSSTTTGVTNIAVYDNTGTTVASNSQSTRNLGSAAITIFQMSRPAIADTTAVHFDTDTWDDASAISTLFGPYVAGLSTTATVAGVGTTTAAGFVDNNTTSTLTGFGAITATGVVGLSATSTLTGTGTTSSTSSVGVNGTATRAGVGVVTTARTLGLNTSSTLNGAGAITTTGTLTLNRSATLNAVGIITVTGIVGSGGTLRDITLTGIPLNYRWATTPLVYRWASSSLPARFSSTPITPRFTATGLPPRFTSTPEVS